MENPTLPTNWLAALSNANHVRSEKIAPLSLSSLRLSPSTPDFLGFAEGFFMLFFVPLPNKTDEQ